MDSRNRKLLILIIAIAVLVIGITGATFAYWSWTTANNQKTEVTFTVTSGFSCSADGGGNITSNDKQLIPASCTNSNYAIKRTVTVSPVINQSENDVYMDLWLKVNSIGSNLASTENFKYALTTSPTNCTTGVVAEGNFVHAEAYSERLLLHNKAYSQTTTETYYLWIWLDAAEVTNYSQNQTFNFSLGGACTNQEPEPLNGTIYTFPQGYISIGNSILPVTVPKWCFLYTDDKYLHDEYDCYNTENECNTTLTTYGVDATCVYGAKKETYYYEMEPHPDEWYNASYLKHTVVDDIITESYVEFIVDENIANYYSGMTIGTYDLRGGIDESELPMENRTIYLANRNVLLAAFGSNDCVDEEYGINCTNGNYLGGASFDGNVSAGYGFHCSVNGGGASICDE